MRTAMGATRSQIVWQLLTESLLLGLAGGLAGLFVCYLSFDFILSLVPSELAHFGEIQLDGRVLLFSLLLGILTGALSGLAPALQSSAVDLNTALKEGKAGSGFGRKRGRLSAALVVSEVGLSLVLLVGAALMFQTLAGLLRTKPGFDSHNLLTFEIGLPRNSEFGTKDKAIAFYDSFNAKLSALPGVQQVSYTSILPLDPKRQTRLLSVEGNSKFDGKTFGAGFRFMSPEYFRAFHIPLVHGREITNADSADSEPVVMINQTMARRIWGDEDAIGQHIWFGKPMGPASMEPAPRRIVGIVGDVIEGSLDQTESNSTTYIPYAQTHGTPDQATFVIRTSQEPSALTPAVREILRSLAPDLPLRAPKTMDELVSASLVDYAALPDNSAFSFWRDGAADCRGWRLRSDFLFRGAADARNWNTSRAGRVARKNSAHGAGARTSAGGDWRDRWADCFALADGLIARSALRDFAIGSGDACGGDNRVAARDACGLLDSCAACDARGSVGGAAIRMSARRWTDAR